MKKLLIIFSICSLNLNAQNYKCGTDFSKFLEDPVTKELFEKENDFALKYTKEKFNPNQKGQVYQVPIVFHVIHNFGPENLPDSEILAALDHMNNRWRKRLADSIDIVAPFNLIHDDMEVEFVLATKDPDGNCSTGILRHADELTYDGGGDGGGATIRNLYTWPPNQYLNVFICSSVGSGVGGYSQYPSGAANGGTDGIMIRRVQLSALAHEAGHYLNLSHLWGDTNDPVVDINCESDDHVEDTPNCIGSAGNCDLDRKTCSTGANADPEPFLSINGTVLQATGQIIDNEQNVMDYAFCENYTNPANSIGENFTQGQKARVHAALESSVADRNNLHTTNNLLLTGTDGSSCNPIPIADFEFAPEYVPTNYNGASILNNSYNSNESISYLWDFGTIGSATSLTAKNPTATWSETGKYDITLEASNSFGSNTITKKVAKILNGESIEPFLESFESVGFPANGNNPKYKWFIDGLSNEESFKKTTEASTDGNASLLLDIKNTNGVHRIISPMIDMTMSSCDTMYFDVAYAPRSNSTIEKLSVKFSTNGGISWPPSNVLFEETGKDIDDYSPILSGDFIPNEGDWTTHKINLNKFNNEDGLLVMFEFTTSSGNRIYLDNVNFGCASKSLVGEDELLNAFNLTLYPNPTNNDANIRLTTHSKVNTLYITDVTGRIIATKQLNLVNGKLNTTVSEVVGNNLNKGIYFITFENNNFSKTEKLIIK